MSRENTLYTLPLALALAAVMLSGCGGGKSNDISASNSQYAPATDDASSSQPAAEAAPPVALQPSSGATAGSASNSSPPPQAASRASVPPNRGPSGIQEGQPAAPNGFRPAVGNAQPRAKVSYEVPEGAAPELLAYIEQLNTQLSETLSQGESLDAVRPELVKNLNAQVAAADKILAAQPEEETRVEAIFSKAKALHAKLQVGAPGAEEELNALLEPLASDASPEIKRLTAVYRLEIPLARLQTGAVEESKPVLDGLEEFLKTVEPKDSSILGHVGKAVETFLMLGREEDAITALHGVRKTFESAGKTPDALNALNMVGMFFEQLGRLDEAKDVYTLAQQKSADLDDQEMKKQVEESFADALKRVGLIGQELKVENMVDLEGKPIDWANYQGKVVLLDFWASWCVPCLREMPNIAQSYALRKEQGFEVIGINLDDDIERVFDLFGDNRPPWTVAVSAKPEERGMANPLAKTCGVTSIPFVLLLDQSGKVAAIHVRGPKLETELEKLLGPAPEGKAPASENPPADTLDPGAEPNATTTPPAKPQGQPSNELELDLPLKPAEGAPKPEGADQGAASEARLQTFPVVFFAADDNAEEQSSSNEEKNQRADTAKPERNPYLADADLSTFELVQFIQDMQDKPTVIQRRPGFAEAIAEAADRVLADREAKEKYQVLAALAKFEYLHDRASFGDEKADEALAAFVEKMKDDTREKIAHEVKLLQLERQALDAEKLDTAQLDKLLADLKAYLEEYQKELGEKHLRIASATVGAINKIEDGDAREKLFRDFGSLFARSSDKELARYGKRLAKEAPGADSALVGQSLELEGLTELGAQFDWESYRGKVVVVDFWATWCGPCRRAAPAVKAFYEAHHAEGFDVVGVNLDQDNEALTQYLDENKIPWPNLVGEDGTRLAEKYGVRGIPTFMLVDREGKVLAVGHSFDDMQSKIEEQLKSS